MLVTTLIMLIMLIVVFLAKWPITKTEFLLIHQSRFVPFLICLPTVIQIWYRRLPPRRWRTRAITSPADTPIMPVSHVHGRVD